MATGLENLKIYQRAVQLELEVQRLTALFPKEERYRSVDQLKRSSASVSNNIAESYHRRSTKDKIRILSDIVKGEAEETRRNLEVCGKKGFHKNFAIIEEYTVLLKMVSGFIRFLKTRNSPTYQPPN